MSLLIAVDGNAVANAHHAATKLTTGGMQTQAVYGFVRMLREMRVSYPDASIVILWDGRSEFRYELHPGYKGARELRLADPIQLADKQAYRAQMPVLKKCVELMGVPQWVAAKHEADDLAGMIHRATPGRKKRLVTGDGDWLQLVDEDTEWYDPRKEGKLVTHATFHESTMFFTPWEFLQGKALMGDNSDSIPGIEGVADATAAKFLAEHRSVLDFYAKVDDGSYKPKVRKDKKAKSLHPEQLIAAQEGRDMFALNLRLMDLRNPAVTPADLTITKGGFDPVKLRTLFDRLGFVSLSRVFDEWTKPFATRT